MAIEPTHLSDASRAKTSSSQSDASGRLFDEVYQSLAKQFASPCPSTVPTLPQELLFHGGAVKGGASVDLLPKLVKYPDGSRVEFTYDNNGSVEQYKDRQGQTWIRDGASAQIFAKQDKKHGGSATKMEFEIQVNPDGSVVTEGSDRVMHFLAPNGVETRQYPSLGVKDLRRLADKNWSSIDSDKSGTLSDTEIDNAVVTASLKGENAMFVAAIKEANSANQGIAPKSPDISIQNFVTLDNLSDSIQAEQKAKNFAYHHFYEIDKDHNLGLSKKEIDDFEALYTSDPCASDGRDALARMKALYSETSADIMTGKKPVELSFGDLSKLDSATEHAPVAVRDLVYASGDFSRMQGALDQASPKLYGENTAKNAVAPKAVEQGRIGDCYLLAAMASLASADPGKLIEMVKPNADGSFTVTFPSPPVSVKVAAPTDAELALYAHSTKLGTWAAVIEKAYGSLNSGRTAIVGQEGADGGARLLTGLQALTGKSYGDAKLGRYSDAELEKLLERFTKEKVPLTLGTNLVKEKFPSLPPHHAYSILGYDQTTKMLTIRNPWGYRELTNAAGAPVDGVNDGIFKMKLSDVKNAFDLVSQPNT